MWVAHDRSIAACRQPRQSAAFSPSRIDGSWASPIGRLGSPSEPLDIKPEVRPKILKHNAIRLLGLDS
jgi:hypothetical protein